MSISPDKVEIKIFNLTKGTSSTIEHFKRYTMNSDVYNTADEFELEFGSPENEFDPWDGLLIEIFVNGDRELTGIVDSVSDSGSKDSSSVTIQGRDMAGLLFDYYIEDFRSLNNKTFKEIVTFLAKDIPFISRKSFRFENPSADFKTKFEKPDPGDTVGDRLARLATSRRLLFFADPDGTIVFGKIPSGGRPSFFLQRKFGSINNNILSGERTRDISGVYSKTVVIGQNSQGARDGSYKRSHSNPDFPFKKVKVSTFNEDQKSASEQAIFDTDQQRREGFELTYRIQGHSQKGNNWKVRAVVDVQDERYSLNESLVIYGRTFTRSREGTFTELRLGNLAERKA